MVKVVVDASVVVKWFIDEIHSENARKIRDEYVNGTVDLTAPELMPFEVLNALRYSGLFKKDELLMVAKSLELYGFELHSLSGNMAENTVKIAVEKDVTIYDAAYVALAMELNTNLYTADEKLIKRVELEFVKHVSEF
jgi:predicted nucleic acid-binding protein